jgi:hypothetical protein
MKALFETAYNLNAVIISRSTPIQKKLVVQVI